VHRLRPGEVDYLWSGTNPILNLEQGKPATEWGRLIFYVVDVDASWTYLKEWGFSQLG
jgi:hypothetical protein